MQAWIAVTSKHISPFALPKLSGLRADRQLSFLSA